MATSLKNLDASIAKLQNDSPESITNLKSALFGLMNLMQGSDMPVTSQAVTAVSKADVAFNALNLKYENLAGAELTALNNQLVAAGLGKLSL